MYEVRREPLAQHATQQPPAEPLPRYRERPAPSQRRAPSYVQGDSYRARFYFQTQNGVARDVTMERL